MPVAAAHEDAVWAGPGGPAWAAGQFLAASFAAGVDGAEGRCGQRGEHARVLGDGFRDALAAGQPGPDELVGVGLVDLGARWAPGGAAGLAGKRQDPAGFVDGGVTVQQFAGIPVDVIDTATQQNRLQASAGVPDHACRNTVGGQRWCSSRQRWRAMDERRRPAGRMRKKRNRVSGALPYGGLAGWPAAQAYMW